VRARLIAVLEACTTKLGFEPFAIASWEADAILAWRDRHPLVLSAHELTMLSAIENAVLGRVRKTYPQTARASH
jgi:hypothetical protein